MFELWSDDGLKGTLGFVLVFSSFLLFLIQVVFVWKALGTVSGPQYLCCSAMFSPASIYLDKYSPAPTLSPLTTMCSEW